MLASNIFHRAEILLYNSMVKSYISFVFFLLAVHAQYSHDVSTYVNTNWMGQLDNGIPVRKLSIVGSHSSMSIGTWGSAFQTQSNSLMGQMNMGIRALDIRCRHYNNMFRIHDRDFFLNTEMGTVLSTVTSFLQTYPMETILMHIVEEDTPSGNTRSFEQTFITYKNMYPSFFWDPNNQNPLLGEVRGKIVIIQNFTAMVIHGLMYSTFTVLPNKRFSSNWDLYDKWIEVKNFISSSNTAGESRIGFWTGHGGSFPYFVASGKSSPGTFAPRLLCGLTTPGFKNTFPEFPRVACFIGICSIAFMGINELAYDYIMNNTIQYMGIVYIDFVDDLLLRKIIGLNVVGQFAPCPPTILNQGCILCSSAGKCLGCNTTIHYRYDSATAGCYAQKGYYLAWSSATVNQPISCGVSIPGCLECSSSTACIACDSITNYQLVYGIICAAAPGYYLDSSNKPVICSLVGCQTCASASVCTTCSSSKNFIMSNSTSTCICDSSKHFVLFASSGTCVCDSGYYLDSNSSCISVPLGPTNSSACSNCSTPSAQICDATKHFQVAAFNATYCVCMTGYFFTGTTCDSCSTNLTNACLSCISASVCLSCKSNFTLFEGKCSCLPQYYSHTPDTCYLCANGCLRCTSASSCLTCDAAKNLVLVSSVCQCTLGMYLNGSTCAPCAMTGCLTCNSAGCTFCNLIFGFTLNAATNLCQCNSGSFINSLSICEPCTQLGCLSCLSQTQCTLCDTNYFHLSSGVCQDICGDGKKYTLACDDGNTVDGDGCSSTCSVETNYTCVGGTTTSQSLCSYSGSVQMKVISFVKDPSENKVYLTTTIIPSLKEFASLDFNSVLVPKFPVQSTNTVYNTSSGVIYMTFTYNQSLNAQNLSVQFVPPAVPAYFYMPNAKADLPYTTDNNLALKIYTQQEYSLSSTIELLALGLAILAVGTFVICFLVVSKLMAIQMILVFQIGYTSLLFLEKLELYMSKLRNLWVVNGYNQLFEDSTTSLPGRVSVTYYKGSFFANFSIDILVVLTPILLGLTCLLIAKVRNNKQYRIMAYRFLKECLLGALLFVQFHLNISIALGISYSSNPASVAFGAIIEALLIILMVLYVRKSKNFGEYTEFFEVNPTAQRWYLLVFLYRTVISFVVGFVGGAVFGIFLSLGFAVIFLVAHLIKKPYIQNIRPLGNCVIVVAILTIFAISKVYQDSSTIDIYTTYTAFFLIGLLFFALAFNIVCMILYFLSRRKREQQKLMAKQIFVENEAESKDMDKMYISAIKQNLKESLMLSKGMQLTDFDIEMKESHKNSLLKVRCQFETVRKEEHGDALQKLNSEKGFTFGYQADDILEKYDAI